MQRLVVWPRHSVQSGDAVWTFIRGVVGDILGHQLEREELTSQRAEDIAVRAVITHVGLMLKERQPETTFSRARLNVVWAGREVVRLVPQLHLLWTAKWAGQQAFRTNQLVCFKILRFDAMRLCPFASDKLAWHRPQRTFVVHVLLKLTCLHLCDSIGVPTLSTAVATGDRAEGAGLDVGAHCRHCEAYLPAGVRAGGRAIRTSPWGVQQGALCVGLDILEAEGRRTAGE